MAQHDATKITNKPSFHCNTQKNERIEKWEKPEHIAHLQFDEKRSKAENCTKPFWMEWKFQFEFFFLQTQKKTKNFWKNNAGVVNS